MPQEGRRLPNLDRLNKVDKPNEKVPGWNGIGKTRRELLFNDIGEDAQRSVQRNNATYKRDPSARKQAIARAASASKANTPKGTGQAKVAKIQRDMGVGLANATENDAFHKSMRAADASMAVRRMQFDLDDAKAMAEWEAEDKRAKSPASIQKGMAASTRKTQAASAKKSAPAPSMRKLLKIK